MLNLVRSLLLASLFAFLLPILLIGGVLTTATLFAQIPGLTPLSESWSAQVLHFLQVFGGGSWLNGVFTIGITCGVVGALFDVYIFFYHQYHRAIHHHPMQ